MAELFPPPDSHKHSTSYSDWLHDSTIYSDWLHDSTSYSDWLHDSTSYSDWLHDSECLWQKFISTYSKTPELFAFIMLPFDL